MPGEETSAEQSAEHERTLAEPGFGDPKPEEIPPADQWGWTLELSPTHLRRLGPIGLELWRRGRQWVNRRVETIELLDVDTVGLRLSVDFRIPRELPGDVEFADKQRTFCLPVTILPRKTSLVYFDVRDEEGTSLPLLTRRENAGVTGSILVAAGRRALSVHREQHGGEQLDLAPGLIAYLAAIPKRRWSAAKVFLKSVLDPDDSDIYPERGVAEVLLHDQDFRDLVSLAASCSFVHVPVVATPGERRIVKLSLISPWDSPASGTPRDDGESWWDHRAHRTVTWLGWQAETRYLTMPHVGNAETFHVQIRAPGRVEFTEAGMRNGPPSDLVRSEFPSAPALPQPDSDDPDDASGYQQFLGGISKRKHLYVGRAHAHRTGIVWVRFRVVRHGFLRAAVSVAWLTSVVLAMFAMRAEYVTGDSQTAAALLLLLPALIAGFLIAPGEHAMTRYLLRGPRFLTAAIGALALVATGAMLTMQSKPAPSVLCDIWGVEAALAAAISVLLTISMFLPGPGKRDTSSPPTEHEQPFIGPPRREDQEELEGNV